MRLDRDGVVEQGMVDRAVPLDDLLAQAVELASGLAGKDRDVLRTIKRRTFAGALSALRAGGDDLRLTLPGT